MLTASGVTLLNKFDDKPIEERKLITDIILEKL